MKQILALILTFSLIALCFTGCELDLSTLLPPSEGTAPSQAVQESTEPERPATEPAEPAVEPTEPETEPPQPVETKPAPEDLLQAVLENAAPVITPYGQAMYLSQYLRTENDAVLWAYTFVDFDQDGCTEMALQTSSETAATIVLHCSGTDVFAFPFGPRELQTLKADGSFTASGGASYSLFFTLRFNGGAHIITTTASGDDFTGAYEINGISCGKREFSDYADGWHAKPDARWTYIQEPPQETTPPASNTPYIKNISHADQGIYKGPGYGHDYVMAIGLPGHYTIVEEAWDTEGNLWGRLKSGVGWVNLTDVDARGQTVPTLTAYYADNALLASGCYVHYVGDTSEYAVKIVFRPGKTLRNVTFHTVDVANSGTIDQNLFYTYEITPSIPLVVEVAFPGDMTTYAICFEDENGWEDAYTVSISGMDGSVVLTPFWA